ncbi:MAG: pentapeptide repeat-containing protein, partial [Planctomycetota bacterium]
DLSGARLTGRDWEGSGALDFRRADLRGAVFQDINLAHARFEEADLAGAAFRNVNLTRADFRGCSGRGALYTDVTLAYADFAASDLRGALFFGANMTDVSFKDASLDGAEFDAIRLSPNGSTHVLGLKEALRALAQQDSYPYLAGVSGDAFWLAYYLKTRELNWGGFANDTLRRGLENFGFRCEFRDEVEEGEAWDALRKALADGGTVITPLHVSGPTVLGSGFGGAEWVFVTGIDRGDVLVNCLLGDAMRFSQERFRAGWCVHHPLEEAAADLPIVYAMCVVGKRERVPSRAETSRAGLRAGVDILTLESTDKVAFGFDAYAAMTADLQSPVGPDDLPADEVRRFLPWLGLGVLHHHGSRGAVRDFLEEVVEGGDLSGEDREAVREARDLYAGACADLQRFLELVPWTFDTSETSEREEAVRRFAAHREEGADLLRAAAAKERDALARFRAVIEPR